MSAFQRQQRRFICHGVKLNALADTMPEGKYPLLQNVRSVQIGVVQSRDGLNALANIGAPIHSVFQMDDPTPFAGKPAVQWVGAGGNVYQGAVNGPYGLVDNGYSGDPLSWDVMTPINASQPYTVVADRSRMRKINSNGTVYPIGTAPPLLAPTSKLGALGFSVIESFTSAFVPWTSVGSQASVAAQINRSNNNIVSIFYDDGAAPSYASIVPGLWDNFGVGELVTINGVEVVPITEVTVAVASTTIATIIYDSGSTGLCTIQPSASLGTGLLDSPDYQAFLSSRTSAAPPPPPPAFVTQGFPRSTERSFPVNALVTIGVETVRILSVAIGPDGIQSFRCSTGSTHNAGDAIVGVAAFRGYVNGTYTGGETLQAKALSNVITPVALTADATPTATAGIRTGAGWAPRNLALVNGRATQPEDDVHLSLRVNLCPEVQTVRVYFSLEPTAGSAPNNTTDFTQDYFFFEWRQSDLAAAVQANNGDPTDTVQQARATFVTNFIENQPILGGLGSITHGGTSVNQNPEATSNPLAIGNSQWLELRCKVGDLIRVGTDTSKTLANVTAAEILVSIEGAAAVQADYDALWISGGFGPDESVTGSPYIYWYRYRSTITGAKSRWSPATRAGVIPHRQAVLLQGVQSSDAQCDVVDWARMGGTLTRGVIVGTTANVNPPVFTDTFGDSAIDNGESIDFNDFQPWTAEDRPYSGVCKVAGSAIQWVSGDQFVTSWAPGTQVIVGGRAYTLYSQPPSTTKLFLIENAGSGTTVPFQVPDPTRIGQTFATWWGGAIYGSTVFFSCGDTFNPGVVHWTTPNNPDVTSDANSVEVTDASEPLQNGYVWDGTPFVASSDQVYALEPTSDPVSPFRPQVTPCGRGFWTRWSFCVAPEGVYFLARDGICYTAGGSYAQSLTDDDLYPLFPHDGVPGVSINGYIPPDMTATAALRLSSVDEWLYFDYLGTDGKHYTLAFYKPDKAWYPDLYGDGSTGAGPTVRWCPIGQQEHAQFIGGSDGQVYAPQVGKVTDGSQAFKCRVQHTENQGDARREKLYRDYMLDATIGTGGSVKVTLGLTNNTVPVAPVTPTTLAGRNEYYVNVTPPIGGFGLNLTALLEWNPVATGLTTLNLWDIAYQLAPELATSWLSGPTTHGQRGFQSVYLVNIAYRATGACTFTLVVDNVTYTYAGQLPSTSGQVVKVPILLQAVKGQEFQYGLQTVDPTTGCQVFDADFEAWVTPWAQNGYQILRPF